MAELPLPHSPLGAAASFDLGPPGAAGGFTFDGRDALPCDVYVGCRHSPTEPWSLLPFFTVTERGPAPLPKGRFGRFLALAGDKWMIGPLVFKLCTPLPLDPNLDEPSAYAPIVCGYLEYDNAHNSEPATLLFGIGRGGSPLRGDDGLGIQFNANIGIATAAAAEAKLLTGAEAFGAEPAEVSALVFSVPAHARRVYPLVIGLHRPGFHHAQFFADLASVLRWGVAHHAETIARSEAQDQAFMRASLDFAAKARLAHEVRQWLRHSRRERADVPIDLTPLREACRGALG